MGSILKIVQLEAAINRCRVAKPFTDGILPTDMRLMAELYGEMIFRRLESVDVDTRSAPLRAVLAKWTAGAEPKAVPAPEAFCAFRPAGTGSDDCEACQ